MNNVEFSSLKVSIQSQMVRVDATIIDGSTMNVNQITKIIEGILKELSGVSVDIGPNGIQINGNRVTGSRRIL